MKRMSFKWYYSISKEIDGYANILSLSFFQKLFILIRGTTVTSTFVNKDAD